MAKKLSKAAAEALAATDWKAIDAMTDSDIARQIAANRDAVRRGCAARLRLPYLLPPSFDGWLPCAGGA